MTEIDEIKKMQSKPLNEMIKLLPKRHFFISFDNDSKVPNYLFCETDGGFWKTVLDAERHHGDFDFLRVSYETGMITLTFNDGHYEITSAGEISSVY